MSTRPLVIHACRLCNAMGGYVTANQLARELGISWELARDLGELVRGPAKATLHMQAEERERRLKADPFVLEVGP